MNDAKRLPDFSNEREEAEWYPEHQDELLEAMQVRKHTLPLSERLGLPPVEKAKEAIPKASPSTAVSIRIANEDIERARTLATKKGVGYQTLLKMMIHEALEREESRGA